MHAGRHASKQLLEHHSGSGAQQEAQCAIPALRQRASRITARQGLCTERITPHARPPSGASSRGAPAHPAPHGARSMPRGVPLRWQPLRRSPQVPYGKRTEGSAFSSSGSQVSVMPSASMSDIGTCATGLTRRTGTATL